MPNIELTAATSQQKKDILDALGAPQWSVDGSGNVDGLASPTGVRLNEVSVISTSGLVVSVRPFSIGSFSFAGGTLTVLPNGTWYVGVEISSKQLRALPRLGHRGWIPVARIVSGATTISASSEITPEMPECRIPRTMKKVAAGQAIKVMIMGSSLTASTGAATDWAGMVFGAGTTDKYKLPVTVTTQYRGVGGVPNQYQLAQLGFATRNIGVGFTGSAASTALEGSAITPNGRSAMFSGVDLVVIGCLANGGDYRLETIEPMVRKLRARGIEVILVTDNPQGPSTNYQTMSAAGLYVDGQEVINVANLYGVELADTAAYVFEAHIRAGGTGIYGDTIHMTTGAPTGPSAVLPANGHEAWARAVRSVFHIQAAVTAPTVTTNTYTFASGIEGWTPYGSATLSAATGALVVTTTAIAAGTQLFLPGALQVGDTVVVTYDAVLSGVSNVQLGTQNGGWAGGPVGVFTGTGQQSTITMTGAATGLVLLFYCQTGTGTLTLDNVTVTVNRAGVPSTQNVAPDREMVTAPMPPIRMVSDLRTPADTFITIPQDERLVATANANCGVLAAHPWGVNSFARCFSSSVAANQDILSVATGKRALINSACNVGFAMIHYREPSDGACTVEVYVDNNLQKTITIAAAPFANEWFQSVYTPTELNAFSTITTAGGLASIELRVTAGTLRIAALVGLTADFDHIPFEQVTYVGTWLPREASRSGLLGRPTDTNGAYAYVKNTGNRLVWIVSGNPGTKLCRYGSGSEVRLNQNFVGNFHIYPSEALFGPGENHYIACTETNASGSQANGRSLHVGGAYAINDR